MSSLPPMKIIDVHLHEHMADDSNLAIREQIIRGLSRSQKSMPTVLLYNERGLRLYDAITTNVPEYYLFPAEEEILQRSADDIVRTMLGRDEELLSYTKPVILELGAGQPEADDVNRALRKTSHLLLALSRLVPSQDRPSACLSMGDTSFTYYALDLEVCELKRTLTELMSAYGEQFRGKVGVVGMWGTYDDGLKFVKEGGLEFRNEDFSHQHVPINHRNPSPQSSRSNSPSSFSRSTGGTSMTPPSSPASNELGAPSPLHLLFLGSSLGNFNPKSSTTFLRSLPLRPGSRDTLLLGLDHDNEKSKIEIAYNDPRGVTRDFIMNGLHAAGLALGDESLFSPEKWEYVNRYNEEERCHEAYYKSTCHQEVHIPGSDTSVAIASGELINIEISQKYSDKDAYSMFAAADLRPIMRWADSQEQYSLWLLERPVFTFPLLKLPNSYGVPALEDFRTIWKAWDTITLGMIPREMLFTKPIDLRHICLFYLGHIPTFLDIHLSRLLGEPHTEPEFFKNIFERGMDPNVDDPSICHSHSEVPQNDDEWPTLESILDFRDRVRSRLTRLYDDLSSGKRTMTRKIGRVLFMTLEHEAFHSETLLYMLFRKAGSPGGTLPPPGFCPPPWELLAKQWNSVPLPKEKTVVLGPADVIIGHDDPESLDLDDEKKFQVDSVEFGWDNEHPKREEHVKQFRIEWRPMNNGELYEFYKGAGKDIIGLPASWIEINGEIQVRTIYGPIPMEYAKYWPVMAAYDDLSKYAQVRGGRLPTEAELRLFYDKYESGYEGGANAGFRNWHPIPPTTGGPKDGGKGHNGGVWEWTSTTFDHHEGFVKSTLYPGFSSDFFDGKHQVVIGGSFATIPRMFGRRALRNWYQHNYPYAWIGGRVAYDI